MVHAARHQAAIRAAAGAARPLEHSRAVGRAVPPVAGDRQGTPVRRRPCRRGHPSAAPRWRWPTPAGTTRPSSCLGRVGLLVLPVAGTSATSVRRTLTTPAPISRISPSGPRKSLTARRSLAAVRPLVPAASACVTTGPDNMTVLRGRVGVGRTGGDDRRPGSLCTPSGGSATAGESGARGRCGLICGLWWLETVG
jgi:hypothetical protein